LLLILNISLIIEVLLLESGKKQIKLETPGNNWGEKNHLENGV